MNTTTVPPRRRLYTQPGANGQPSVTVTLTPAHRTDTVQIVVQLNHVLPVVFVPGIMGSNLKKSGTENAVWRLDDEEKLGLSMGFKNAGERQRLLHPNRVEVDPRGKVPESPVGVLRTAADFRARGWGEVGHTSYNEFLVWAEKNFNSQRCEGTDEDTYGRLGATLLVVKDGRAWGAQKPFDPLTEDESRSAQGWSYPVHACGYNWLDDNEIAAQRLAKRIDEIIAQYSGGMSRCTQVIVITHSMGGLVARRCAQLPGMAQKIAGVVHGVMPAVGAPVAYRRCKVGMMDEGASGIGKAALGSWGVARVIGATGQEVTAVFAQSPGALQLLPTAEYPRAWLEVRDIDSASLSMAGRMDTAKPYDTVYTERQQWWGLVKEDWLKPKDGEPLTWTTYLKTLRLASSFHAKLNASAAVPYHPNTYAFYGHGVPSFETVCWQIETLPTEWRSKRLAGTQALDVRHDRAVMDGTNPEQLRGAVQGAPTYNVQLLPAADSGDGTVPVASGRAPLPNVHQIFGIPGIEHEPAYKSGIAQHVTAYAITRIAASAAQAIGAGKTTKPGAAR
ncbi:MAG: hypothetical protein J0H69_06445 [Burkholderiales bacterium]|nr:hypothetical protein [Burkholderiales bacterium]